MTKIATATVITALLLAGVPAMAYEPEPESVQFCSSAFSSPLGYGCAFYWLQSYDEEITWYDDYTSYVTTYDYYVIEGAYSIDGVDWISADFSIDPKVMTYPLPGKPGIQDDWVLYDFWIKNPNNNQWMEVTDDIDSDKGDGEVGFFEVDMFNNWDFDSTDYVIKARFRHKIPGQDEWKVIYIRLDGCTGLC